MNKGVIIFLISVLIVTFFYDYLPINDQLKSLLPRNKFFTAGILCFLILIPLFIFLVFMYYFTTFIQFIRKYFKNKN
jgi:hypothetical protein